jgi:hypothetical protein
MPTYDLSNLRIGPARVIPEEGETLPTTVIEMGPQYLDGWNTAPPDVEIQPMDAGPAMAPASDEITMAPEISAAPLNMLEGFRPGALPMPGQTEGEARAQTAAGGALDALGRPFPELENAAGRIDQLRGQRARLFEREQEIVTEMAGLAEGDPARETLAKRASEIAAARQQVEAGIGQARAEFDRASVSAERDLGARANQADLAAATAARSEQERLQRQAEGKLAENEQARAAAQTRYQTAKRQYVAAIQSGPKESVGWAVGNLIGEFIMAYAQNRQPDITGTLERWREQNRDQWALELQGLEVGTQAIGDEIEQIAQTQREIETKLAIEQEAVIEAARADLAERKASAASQLEAAQLQALDDLLEREQQQAQAKALAQAEKDEIERRLKLADLELKGAQIDKARADALKASRQAGGAGMGKTGEEIPADALVDPVTGRVIGISRFGGVKVRDDQQTINDFSTALRDVEAYMQRLARVGRVYQGLGAKAVRSQEVAELQQLYNDLFMKTQRALTGAAATVQEQQRIAEIIPGPKSFSNMGEFDPAKVIQQYKERMTTQLEDFAISRVETGAKGIRGGKGETLPESFTYGIRQSAVRDPVQTKGGAIVSDLAQRHQGSSEGYRETIRLDIRRRNPRASDKEIDAKLAERIDESDAWKSRAMRYWSEAATAKEASERDEVINAMRDARNAFQELGDSDRVEYLDRAIEYAGKGKGPSDWYRDLAK